jgi:hypothetical protein
MVDIPSFCGIFAPGLPPMQDATARKRKKNYEMEQFTGRDISHMAV